MGSGDPSSILLDGPHFSPAYGLLPREPCSDNGLSPPRHHVLPEASGSVLGRLLGETLNSTLYYATGSRPWGSGISSFPAFALQ